MIASYVFKDGKFVSITSDKQIKIGDIVDLYADDINHYFVIHSLLPNYANNWINNSMVGDNVLSYSLMHNNNIRPYFEYREGVIGLFGWFGQEWNNIRGGIGREWHNTTQEVVKHPLVLAIPAALIAAPFLIPALGIALGTAAGAVGSGISAAYGAVAGAVVPIVADVGSDITAAYSAVSGAVAPIVSAGEKILSPIEKFGEDILHDIIPIAPKVAGKAAPTILSTIEGGASDVVGDVAKTIGTGLAVSLASKLLGSNSQHQILEEGASDSGYNSQQSQAYANQYQNSLSRYAEENNMSSNDAMSQTAAYVYAHLRDYINHGYTTAKQAIFATLKKTGGIPPTANTPISSILGSSNSMEKYLPLILIGGAGILLIKLMGNKKSSTNMEMANG